jgi:hypothetical protein
MRSVTDPDTDRSETASAPRPSVKDAVQPIHRGALPRTIPSRPASTPDCRDLTGSEWRVRKPTRRDSQCVQL